MASSAYTSVDGPWRLLPRGNLIPAGFRLAALLSPRGRGPLEIASPAGPSCPTLTSGVMTPLKIRSTRKAGREASSEVGPAPPTPLSCLTRLVTGRVSIITFRLVSPTFYSLSLVKRTTTIAV